MKDAAYPSKQEKRFKVNWKTNWRKILWQFFLTSLGHTGSTYCGNVLQVAELLCEILKFENNPA